MISEYNSVKETLRDLLEKSGEDIDLCEYFPDLLGGIGHNELRHFWIGENGEIEAESNNVHDTEKGEDCYKSYVWEEMTDFEKAETRRLFSIIRDTPPSQTVRVCKGEIRSQSTRITYKPKKVIRWRTPRPSG